MFSGRVVSSPRVADPITLIAPNATTARDNSLSVVTVKATGTSSKDEECSERPG